ncbi:MAG: hypothetical protein ACOC0N_08115 [Chroococcales cyanobacterium]
MVKAGSNPTFQARQIVYLEQDNSRLYTEVIQVIASRQLCWVRPLMLATFPKNAKTLPTLPKAETLYDMRQASDLVWYLSLFSPALDTEVIPLITQLDSPALQIEEEAIVRQRIHRFIQTLWEANKENLLES